MEGHIRKRGSKWYYSFEASTVNGKRKRIERVGGKTKKEAELLLRKALEEYNNAGLHFKVTEISVSDYMDYWFKNYVQVNCKYNTQNAYESIIKNHIKPTFGIYKLKSLTSEVLQKFINDKYISGISKNHLSNIITILSSSFKYAIYPCKFIKDNPMKYIKYPKYEHSKIKINHKVISKNEFVKIIKKFPPETTFHIPIMIGYYTGCRISEVMGLTWEDIDFEKETIDINKIIYKRKQNWYFGSTKTKSSVRKIKIGKTLIDSLKNHKKWQIKNRLKYGQHFIQQYEITENTIEKLRKICSFPVSVDTSKIKQINMVCTKENGNIITPDTFKYASRVINYNLGILFNFHSLRHTHATTLIENGANIKDVQTRLGHNNIKTTLDTYAHSTEKMAEQSVNIFENAINHNLPTK